MPPCRAGCTRHERTEPSQHARRRLQGARRGYGSRSQSRLRALPWAEPIAYGDGLVERARSLAPDGFDVILDYVGGAAIETAPALLSPGGRIVSITDARARTELGGDYVWVRPDAADLTELAALADQGVLTVEVAEGFDLEHAADAMRAVESGHVRGKVVVRVCSPH